MVASATKLKDACQKKEKKKKERMLAPWKKSFDKPRQHMKKRRHHFADKGPYYSQNYVFSSRHAQM